MVHNFIVVNRTFAPLLLSCWLLTNVAACTVATPTPIPTPTTQSGTNDEIAIITQVIGDVTIPSAVGNEQAATPFNKVVAGTTIRTALNSSATIVCLSGHAYQVTGGQSVAVTSTHCQSAQPLPVNSVPAVVVDNGRLIASNDGSSVLNSETRERESDYGQLPIILSPRNTTVMALTPALRWIDVTSALEYELSLSGLASFAEIVVDVSNLTCHDDVRTTPNRICTHPWPIEWQLVPGQRYFLTVSARTNIAAPLRESETSALRTLPEAEATQLQAAATDIAALDLDVVTRNLLLAGHYRTHNVIDQAIDAYTQAYAIQPAPEIAVALGDLYLAVDLERFAFFAYQNALEEMALTGTDKPDVRAAAEFGLGLVYYSRGNYIEAETHLAQAVDLYTVIGIQKEKEDAEAVLKETRDRSSGLDGSDIIEGETR